jgi:glycosyltransferase involved in cell wall biosynthesis
VSVVIPVLNEERYIAECIESVLSQSYPKDRMEVLLVDGMSKDSTRRIIEGYSQSHPYVRLLDNPRKVSPAALNIGIKASRGSVIVRLDAHTYYDRDYVAKCVETLEKVDAQNVGGPIVTLPGDDTPKARAIAAATSHPFGVGNSKFRTSAEPQFVDTVPFGAFRREVFDRLGSFNEHLTRNQDIEFNIRIRRAGGRIYLNPEIKSFYYNRSTLKALWRQNFVNGMWNIFTQSISGNTLSMRHYVPLIFVSALITGVLIAPLHPIGLLQAGAVLLSYAAANLYYSVRLGLRNGARLIPHIMAAFLALHFSYGLGSLWGILTVRRWRRVVGALQKATEA